MPGAANSRRLPTAILEQEEVNAKQKRIFDLNCAWVAVLSLILFLCGGLARGQISSANYTFVMASGFLCNSGDSGSCPAIAKSAIGDSYEISGAGTFDLQNKSVRAAGTFIHKSTNGNVLETGVWTALRGPCPEWRIGSQDVAATGCVKIEHGAYPRVSFSADIADVVRDVAKSPLHSSSGQ